MKCSLCGSENNGGKFCTSCGAKLPEAVDIPQEIKDEALQQTGDAGTGITDDAVQSVEGSSPEIQDVNETVSEGDVLEAAGDFSDAVDEAFTEMKGSTAQDEEDPTSNYYDAGFSSDAGDTSGTYSGSIPTYDSNYAVGGGSIGFAIAALTCGCLSILCCCAGCLSSPLSIAAIVCGTITIKKDYDGRGMALAGIITGGIGLLLQVITTIYAISEM